MFTKLKKFSEHDLLYSVMAKFITGFELSAALTKILSEAQRKIVLISPYVKLHKGVKATLLEHKDNHNIKITLVFGKNEDDVSKSISREDVEFFTQFPNVEIRHEKRLHAKYYANENAALITSMNLYEFSQNNNIEAGILIKPGVMGMLDSDSNLDKSAYDCFTKVIKQANLLFERLPEYDRGIVGTGVNRKYLRSVTKTDFLQKYFGYERSTYPVVAEKPARYSAPQPMGFCIRSGVNIPFDPERPFSESAYRSWNRHANPDYKEQFCHFSGEFSYGETSYAFPIMRKNWPNAREVHGF